MIYLPLAAFLPSLDPSLSASSVIVLGYIDPGTASLLFQAAVAAFLSAGLAFRQVREKIRSLFVKAPPPAVEAAPPEQDALSQPPAP